MLGLSFGDVEKGYPLPLRRKEGGTPNAISCGFSKGPASLYVTMSRKIRLHAGWGQKIFFLPTGTLMAEDRVLQVLRAIASTVLELHA